MDQHTIHLLENYVRAANYITAAQIYLQSNILLTRPLTFDDIKPRLLGHWGTCPGINFIYAHLNYFIKKHQQSTLFMLGPGHGFPALQANLFMEGTLHEFYPQATANQEGLIYLCKNFSWPHGFPSHVYPGTPRAILEGGELGYALSTAYGAILDNPDLLVACVIGDGEAETGPTATAWHLNKFIDPATNGTVLPILHLNGYKISGPTLFGRMTNRELKSLFVGYGYDPLIVEGNDANLFVKMAKALEQAYHQIQTIKKHAQTHSYGFARFPMIIVKTKKGWTGPRWLDGKKIEGNNLSHQVVLPNAKTDKQQLIKLEKWLKSYRFNELFDAQTGFNSAITDLLPPHDLKMGENKHVYTKTIYQPLKLPDASEFSENSEIPGTIGSSSMRRAGLYLREVCRLNQQNFRFFSPDEIYSNKLDAMLEVTHRAFMLPLKSWDKDLAPSGRVIEMLSEHSLQGLAQGYVLTGRHAVFASYEAFIEIISSMADQYAKFLKVAQEYPWRGPYASLNYILTSSGWRQEHNGFSHQNPGFIGGMLEKYCSFIHAYFPPDGNSTLAVLEHCLTSKNAINIIVAGKTLEPRWLTLQAAKKELADGLMIWDFASNAHPDIVFAAVGDYLTKEALAAIDLLKECLPQVKVRFVNIMVLSGLGKCGSNYLTPTTFNHYFTSDKPVIFNYHGYPETLKAILFDQKNTERFSVHGYIENGSTTTPFDMQVRNHTSRYHLVIKALELLHAYKVIDKHEADTFIKLYEKKLYEHAQYIIKHGVDPKEIEEWQWKKTTS
jgi:xylulose-5-phosphate/fructose-6-phosphate phosphoketolase